MAAANPNVRVGVGVFILGTNCESPKNPSFLIGKRIGSHGAGSYALPGGHLEFGETPEECAEREVLEETGLKVVDVRYLTTTNDIMHEDNKHYVTMLMVCTRANNYDVPAVLEPDKCEGWEWIDWEILLRWIQNDGVDGRRVFTPLVSLVQQRPGLIPTNVCPKKDR